MVSLSFALLVINLRLLNPPIANSVCTIEVSISGPPIMADWYNVWTSAVSIVAMCVRSYKEGASIGQCSFSALMLFEVDRVDFGTAAGDTEITIRIRNEKAVNTLEDVA